VSEPHTLTKDDRIRPFANGTEHMMWLDSNCERGERGCRNYNPNATSSRHGCPVECAIARAGWTDGKIPMRIALRGGFVEPGPNGTLVDATFGTDSQGRPCTVIPACPEYRGYDEPDDRPRRGPQPPAEQLDLLDPRNAPDRSTVLV